MKRRLTSLLLAFVMVIGLLPGSALAAGGEVSGSGTAVDPYVIADAEDLAAVSKDLAGNYILTADIAPSAWTKDLGKFTGTFDGNGYTIALPDGAESGLFGNATTGTIEDLVVKAPGVTSTAANGGILVNGNFGGKIRNCAVIGTLTVKGSGAAGGVAGQMNNNNALIENTFAAVSFIKDGTTEPSVGALLGVSGTAYAKGKLTGCYYDSQLCAAAIKNDAAAQAGNCTGKTTEECKTLAATLNAARTEGMLSWADTDTYPTLASHNAVLSGDVTLTGTAKQGETLKVEDTFAPSDDDKTLYTWYRINGLGTETAIEGADSASYTLTAEDVGFKLRVQVSRENTIGSRTTDVSDVVAAERTVTLSFTGAPEGAEVTLAVKNSAGSILGYGTTVEIPAAGAFTWYATAEGYDADCGTVTANGEDLTVTVELHPLSKAWTTEESNGMLIGSMKDATRFPTGLDDASLRWVTCAGLYGSGVGSNGEVTNAVYMDGYLYIIGGEGGKQQIQKIDPDNGQIVKRTFLHGQGGFYYFLACGGDMIYFRGNGYVQAFNKELEQVWLYEDATIPTNYAGSILYDSGYVYFGTAATRTYGVASFYCLSAADGSLIWKHEAELNYANGDTSDYWGFYWAGPLVVGDYVVCGSDGGRVYSWDRYTGKVADRLDVGKDMGYTGKDVTTKPFIRTGIITDGEGTLYFNSTDCYLHKVTFDEATGKFGQHTFALIGEEAGAGGNAGAWASDTATGTPVLSNGRIYAATMKAFAVFNAQTLEKIYTTSLADASNKSLFGAVRDLRLLADEEGGAWLFASYYKKPGSVLLFRDAADQTTSSGVVDLSSVTAGYEQYNATSAIFGPDGTIYATNDLGYLFAIEKPAAKLTAMTASTGELDQAFAPAKKTYELVVPKGTGSVTLNLAATPDAVITVNGETVVDGAAEVALTNGKGEAVIVVTLGTYSIRYTVSIREISSETGISVVTSSSNNIGSSTAPAIKAKGADNAYALVGCNSSSRMWLATVDPNAEMAKPTMDGYNATQTNNQNEWGGLTYRWRFYLSGGPTYPLMATAVVTAEDGVTTKTYYSAMFGGKATDVLVHDANGDGSFDPASEYMMALQIDKTSHSFSAVGESVTLTASAQYAGVQPENTDLTWSSSDAEVATVDETGKVTILKHGSAVISARNADGLGGECTVTLNTAPALKEGVQTTATAEIDLGESYTLDLTGIFEDADSDALSYTVAINGADPVQTPASYSYKPAAAGEYTLVFTADDGFGATAVHTVTLTVKKSGGTGPVAPKSITVYASVSGDAGKFLQSKKSEVMWNVPVTVYDENGDGKYTLDEALMALHETYHPNGQSAYASNGEWVSTFWGDDSMNFGFVINDKWCKGAAATVRKDSRIAAYIYQDVSNWNDLYTYFGSTSYSATAGKEKSFQVKGLNIMLSGETSSATAAPEGADVTVYDRNGKVVYTTTTDEDGKFTLNFSAAGTYTVEVSGICDYTADGEYGGGSYTDAPVVPARCTVTVSGSGSGGITPVDPVKPAGSSFIDVKESDYFYKAVQWAVEKGITNGTGENTFSPEAACTRAQMVTFLWRAAGKPKAKTTAQSFTDVDRGAYYYEALLWAVELGITNGTGEGTFSPDMPCTRGQMAAFLYRYAKSPAVTGDSSFTDVKASDYFSAAVTWAAKENITKGTGEGVFSPEMVCTRGQMVTFLYRFLGESAQ